jgi:hypothetical protein
MGTEAAAPDGADGRQSADLDALLSVYLRCLDEAERVPAFSAWMYLRLAYQLWLWEVAFLAFFLAPFLDLVLLAMRPVVAWRPRSPTRAVARYLARPFRSVWRGDISGLQVVRVGMLTRAFLGAHIAGAVDRLKLRLERERLEALLSGNPRGVTIPETEQKKLEALGNLAKATNAFGAALATGSASALPLALAKLLVPLLVQHLPQDFNDQVGKVLPLGQVLKTIGLAGEEGMPGSPTIIAITGGFLCFLLITVMSCHIEKRRIMQETGAYLIEDAILGRLHARTLELPLDVVFATAAAMAGFLTMYLYAVLALPEPTRSEQTSTALYDLVFCVAVAAVVVSRRLWIRLVQQQGEIKFVSVLSFVIRPWRSPLGLLHSGWNNRNPTS